MSALFGRFSRSSEAVLVEAQRIAEELDRPVLSDLLILSMLTKPSSPATDLLRNTGLNQQALLEYLSTHRNEQVIRAISQFKEIRTLLVEAVKTAARFRFPIVEVEHLLYVIASDSRFVGHHLLGEMSIDPKQITSRLSEWLMSIAILSQNNHSSPGGPLGAMGDETGLRPSRTDGERSELNRYLFDITEAAARGERDPVIGREKEIAQMQEILLRRQKNNPLLLGEAGVGKTALVDGLAQRIIARQVPQALSQKRIYLLDLSLVVAGTMYRGQFEERLKSIIQEIQEIGNAILFIDEIHTLTGAGSAEGSFDAANILKPALARGELSIIGATTHDEYRRHILKDRALDRRFQVVNVEEPASAEAIKMVRGIRKELEQFHQVQITDEAVRSAVELSSRYIHDRFLPDKAIDVLDQACTLHAEPYTGEDEIEQLERALSSVQYQKDEIVQQAESTDVEAWQLAHALREKEASLLEQIEQLEEKVPAKSKRKSITTHHVSLVIAERTGIPLTDIEQSLQPLDIGKVSTALKRHILGQDHAVTLISRALMRAQLGLNPAKKPIGSFLLVGPTGVGKTETARVLAREVFGDAKALVKIDMSEFMERHTVSNLIGAPAGYVGYDQGGSLTEQIRRRPYAVVLFDEVEKAHPDVFNLLLQILEDGTLTDNTGMAVSFEHTLVILTSNIGMDSFNQVAKIGFSVTEDDPDKVHARQQEELEDHIRHEIDDFFRPELLGRLSSVIFYQPLHRTVVRRLFQKRIQELKRRMKGKGITIHTTATLLAWLVDQFQPEAGARSIDRVFLEAIEPVIIEHLITHPKEKDISLTLVRDQVTVVREGAPVAAEPVAV